MLTRCGPPQTTAQPREADARTAAQPSPRKKGPALAAWLRLMDRRGPRSASAPGGQGGEAKLYPQRYSEPTPTTPAGMPCGSKPGASVGRRRGDRGFFVSGEGGIRNPRRRRGSGSGDAEQSDADPRRGAGHRRPRRNAGRRTPALRRNHLREQKGPCSPKATTGFLRAERVGFEPTSRMNPLLVFETSSFNRSDTSPGELNPCGRAGSGSIAKTRRAVHPLADTRSKGSGGGVHACLSRL